ncbi:TonB-dependent receptor [Shewanella morhuae]|uniref:Outer membrane receptor for Fe3+-dicitrate n=1 Tax=Shewanella morhuae TaxID=365591 RepID=A0A379ZXM4_9GAMM|nr:TonB-dependent receptor [Shewanella morhuae]SUI69462.1 Outer membrane receptor for Fe3+-dicitrate [Shewanella morhuae]
MNTYMSGGTLRYLLILTFLLTSPMAAYATELEKSTTEIKLATGDTSFAIGERITVVGKRSVDASKVLTSVDRMSGELVQSADVDYAWQLLGRLPGVTLTEFNQGTTSGKLSFRGFNGEGEINAVKLLINGIPSNSNDGNMPYIDMILPLEISTVEVVRGTTDPRYGLHNIAGNVSFETRSGGDYFDTKLTTGSFGKNDVQVVAGVETGAFRQNYAVGYREAEGYRDHSDFSRRSFAGKWAFDLSDNMTLAASARTYSVDAKEPGYLTRDVAYTTPRATNDYNQSDEGDRDINQFSVSLDTTLSTTSTLRILSWLNQFEDNRYVTYSANVAQQNRYTEEEHYGALASVSFEPAVSYLHRLFIETGASVEVQDNISKRFLTKEQVATSQTRDQKFDLTITGAYVQTMLEPTKWLRVTPAWRVDQVRGDFTDNLNDLTASANDYGTISQPKLSIAVFPITDLTLFANWGRTFQIGVGSGSYLIPPRQDDVAPSINEGWEVGTKYQPLDSVDLRLALWNQTATGELKRRLNDPAGDVDNIGATERHGVDLQASWALNDDINVWGSVAWQQAEIDKADPQTPELKGNDIDHIPQWIYNAGVDFSATEKLSLSALLRAQSKYELNTANSAGRYGDFILLNVSARYALNNSTDLAFEIKNLTDEYYEYVWWDGSQTLHSPNEGRSVNASISLHF